MNMPVSWILFECSAIFTAFTSVLILLFIYIVYSCGFFSDIEVKVQKSPFKQIDVAYKYTKGPYPKWRQLTAEVQQLAPHLDSFVILHDDPRVFPDQNLSYAVGAIVRNNKRSCNKQMCQILLRHGYCIASFPAVDYVIMAAFPLANHLSLVAGVIRVYPKMKRFIEEKKLCAHPMMEIYTRDKILFLAPLSQQYDFYVPEAAPRYYEPDSESSGEEQTPSYHSKSRSARLVLPLQKSVMPLQEAMFKKRCMCDNGNRSHSCDYCKRTL